VGVGTIVEALITGLCASGEQRANLLLSPRNERIANRLAQRLPFAKVAADNRPYSTGVTSSSSVSHRRWHSMSLPR